MPPHAQPLPPPEPRPGLVVCDGCAGVFARRPLLLGEVAQCTRCGEVLGRGHRASTEAQLALAVASAVVFAIANAAPIIELNLRGVRTDATLIESIRATWDTGQHLVALLAAATALVFPGLVIALRLYLLVPLVLGRRAPGFAPVLNLLGWATRWSMVEVFMLGTLIATVRSASLAHASVSAGILAFGALTLLLTAHQAAGVHGLWRRASQLGPT